MDYYRFQSISSFITYIRVVTDKSGLLLILVISLK